MSVQVKALFKQTTVKGGTATLQMEDHSPTPWTRSTSSR